MSPSLLSVCVLGATFGLRHALEPDHLAAIAALAVQPGAKRRWFTLGATWGLGHALTLLLVGALLSALKTPMPPRLGVLLELAVAGVIVALGARSLLLASHAHSHSGHSKHHAHPNSEAHIHLGTVALAWRPLLTGVAHGLAGSGALTALVLSTLPSTHSRVLYTALFGLGALAGMATLTGLAGVPLRHLDRLPRASNGLSYAAGVGAMVFGSWWGLGAVRAMWG